MTSAHRPTILLLEDQPFIALDVEDTIANACAGEAVIIDSCARAEAWLDENTPDVAVVDVFLHDGACTAIVEVLVEREVPFVVHSVAMDSRFREHDVFLQGHWVPKPAAPGHLANAIIMCLATAATP
ncbi:response regulator [Rhizobium sp. TRM95796]|uniref:response regulator n=1 Tax=Rhizobium sp. TRM95796 TaxID=2979862 RepID=UPI0021E89674|nr:response regulator [Rhizobium sp. TRM95796]MCV3769108.1 response regulator [Rhizobium sp. TRM95796]